MQVQFMLFWNQTCIVDMSEKSSEIFRAWLIMVDTFFA